MTPSPEQPAKTQNAAALAGGMLLLAAGLLAAAGFDPGRWLLAVSVVVTEGPLVVAWWVAALGWGLGIVALAGRSVPSRAADWVVALGLGAATMCLWAWCLGVIGVLSVPVAWGVGATGWALAAWRLVPWWKQRGDTALPVPAWPWALAGLPVGLMFGAATVAPGLCWPSEAMGYDVLSYHLQLPRQWHAAGAIEPSTFSAYSYFPNLFEAAFYHLGVWRGSVVDAAYAGQMLHASMAVLAAAGIACAVDRLSAEGARCQGALAGALYLAVPWTIVTGALAYNEQAVAAFGAAALLVLLGSRGDERRPLVAGVLAGILGGAAVLSKLSAAAMVAVPLAIAAAWPTGPDMRRRALRTGGLAIGGALLVMLWCVRNAVWVGNPVFPMFTGALGSGHWTPVEVERWGRMMRPTGGLGEALTLLFGAERGFGHAQHAGVWALGLMAGAAVLSHGRTRRMGGLLVAVGVFQVIAWLGVTHHQSRFLVPVLWPVAMLCGLALILPPPNAAGLVRAGGAALVVALGIWSVVVYQDDANRAAPIGIGGVGLMGNGDADYDAFTAMNQLPEGSKIYSEAMARPFYVRTPIDYHTVWDPSPIGPALAQGPGAAGEWLARGGYTHVVIGWGMLKRWSSKGNYGYDPAVTAGRLEGLVGPVLEPIGDWGGQIGLYRVRTPTKKR